MKILGVDPSGKRVGLAIVEGNQALYYCVVKKLDIPDIFDTSAAFLVDLKMAIQEAISDAKGLDAVIIEDPTAFALATARGQTNRQTNRAALVGFAASTQSLLDALYLVHPGLLPVMYITPMSWQSRIGVHDGVPMLPDIRSALDAVPFSRNAKKAKEENTKRAIRGVVAWRSGETGLLLTEKGRGNPHFIIEQDAVDAIGIAMAWGWGQE